MNDNETIPKATVAKILAKVLEIYHSDDAARKADFFERELPNLIATENFEFNPAKNNKEGE